MKKAALVVQAPYAQGEIFRKESSLNRDDCLAFFHELKKSFAERGIDLNTSDINTPEASSFVLYNEMPAQLPTYKEKSVVFLFESELIRPDNWNKKRHEFFSKVFTWHDDLVDNQKYFKFNFTHSGETTFLKFTEKRFFCTLVAGNKQVDHPLELYSKRVESIRWFENNHPEEFSLYGIGWNKAAPAKNLVGKVLRKLPLVKKILVQNWPSYKGPVDSKLLTLRNFKFSICYENARDIPGYITEKVFDSMAAGCIPIYWGAPRIDEVLPSETFIDRRNFKSHEELYDFLKNMSEPEYNSRLDRIGEYLRSPAHLPFTPRACAEKVVGDIMGLR